MRFDGWEPVAFQLARRSPVPEEVGMAAMDISDTPLGDGRLTESDERPYSARAAISNAIVRIHARSYGRGPTKARTFLTDEYALCVLEHIFTPAEQTLIAAGADGEVHQMRRRFQQVVSDQFIGEVEEIAHRKVRAFFSNVQHDPDIAIELFLFEPQDEPESVTSLDGEVP
jgi:uncharacterized protein YbcI